MLMKCYFNVYTYQCYRNTGKLATRSSDLCTLKRVWRIIKCLYVTERVCAHMQVHACTCIMQKCALLFSLLYECALSDYIHIRNLNTEDYKIYIIQGFCHALWESEHSVIMPSTQHQHLSYLALYYSADINYTTEPASQTLFWDGKINPTTKTQLA